MVIVEKSDSSVAILNMTVVEGISIFQASLATLVLEIKILIFFLLFEQIGGCLNLEIKVKL